MQATLLSIEQPANSSNTMKLRMYMTQQELTATKLPVLWASNQASASSECWHTVNSQLQCRLLLRHTQSMSTSTYTLTTQLPVW